MEKRMLLHPFSVSSTESGLIKPPRDPCELGLLAIVRSLRHSIYGDAYLFKQIIDWCGEPYQIALKRHVYLVRLSIKYLWLAQHDFWWGFFNTLNLTVAMANGWKGQRIFIVPAQELLVTITSDIEGNNEDATIAKIMNTWIFPAVKSPVALPPSVDKDKYLAQLLNEVQAGKPRWTSSTESRMVPSVSHKEKRRPFRLPQ